MCTCFGKPRRVILTERTREGGRERAREREKAGGISLAHHVLGSCPWLTMKWRVWGRFATQQCTEPPNGSAHAPRDVDWPYGISAVGQSQDKVDYRRYDQRCQQKPLCVQGKDMMRGMCGCQAAPVRARVLAHTHTGMDRNGHATRGHALGHACKHGLGTQDLASDPQLIRLGPVFHVRFRYGGTRHARPHAVARQGAATTHVNARARVRNVQDVPAPELEQQDDCANYLNTGTTAAARDSSWVAEKWVSALCSPFFSFSSLIAFFLVRPASIRDV